MHPIALTASPWTRWTLPFALITSLVVLSWPQPVQADAFATSLRGLGGYALLRQGDPHGAWSLFDSALAVDPNDPLLLQGMAEVSLFQRDTATWERCTALLEAQGQQDRLRWLAARQAHANGQWSAALAGYAICLTDPAWAAWADTPIEALYRELGDRPFAGLVRGLAETQPHLAGPIELRLESFRLRYGVPSEWDLAPITGPELESAVRAAWDQRAYPQARTLLESAALQAPRDPHIQVLLREQMLVEMNQTPVPPARRRIPAGAIVNSWSGESGWELGGLLPQDLPVAGPLKQYWDGMLAINAVSERYYLQLMQQMETLKVSADKNVQERNAYGLHADLTTLFELVDNALFMSAEEVAAMQRLGVPHGFEAFAAKVREYQDLRTAAFTDLKQLLLTQNPEWAEHCRAKAQRLDPMAEEAAGLFFRAYERAPQEWKTPPASEPEAAGETAEGEASLVDPEDAEARLQAKENEEWEKLLDKYR